MPVTHWACAVNQVGVGGELEMEISKTLAYCNKKTLFLLAGVTWWKKSPVGFFVFWGLILLPFSKGILRYAMFGAPFWVISPFWAIFFRTKKLTKHRNFTRHLEESLFGSDSLNRFPELIPGLITSQIPVISISKRHSTSRVALIYLPTFG